MVNTQSGGPTSGALAPDFALPSTTGSTVSLSDFEHADALMVAFICNHCPYVKHMLAGLVRYANDYAGRSVAVVAINSNDVLRYPEDAPEKMATLARAQKFPFSYLFDESQQVAAAYEAVCTPDLYLFGSKRNLVYRGQFDPSRPGSGQAVTGSDLRAATEALLAGRAIERQIASIGCSIKWKPGREPR